MASTCAISSRWVVVSPMRSTSRCVLLCGSTDVSLRVTNSRTAPPRVSLTTPPPPPHTPDVSSQLCTILNPFHLPFVPVALWPSPARRLSSSLAVSRAHRHPIPRAPQHHPGRIHICILSTRLNNTAVVYSIWSRFLPSLFPIYASYTAATSPVSRAIRAALLLGPTLRPMVSTTLTKRRLY